MKADYRMDGKEELIVVTESGDVKGYIPSDAETIAMNYQTYNASADLDDSTDAIVGNNALSEDQAILLELQSKKLDLLNELKALESSNTAAQNKSSSLFSSSGTAGSGDTSSGVLPPDASLSYALIPDIEAGCVDLEVSALTDVQIITLIAIDSGMNC